MPIWGIHIKLRIYRVFLNKKSLILDLWVTFFREKSLLNVTISNKWVLRIFRLVFTPRNSQTISPLPKTLSADAEPLG